MKQVLLKIWTWIKANSTIVFAIVGGFILYMFFNPFDAIDNWVDNKLKTTATPKELYNKIDSIQSENVRLDSILNVYKEKAKEYGEKIQKSNNRIWALRQEINALNEEALTYEGIQKYIDSLQWTPIELHEYWLKEYNIKN